MLGILLFNPYHFFFFIGNVPPQQIVDQWAAQGIDEMDFNEASSEITTTELQLQNCEEIPEEKQFAFKGHLISECLFDALDLPPKKPTQKK